MTEFKDITEMAACVSQALEAAGIRATLSGGAAVSIYSDSRYQSLDLDFITSARNEAIAPVLEPLGFEYVRGRREFYHPRAEYFLEFPLGPLALGETTVSDDEATVPDGAALQVPALHGLAHLRKPRRAGHSRPEVVRHVVHASLGTRPQTLRVGAIVSRSSRSSGPGVSLTRRCGRL